MASISQDVTLGGRYRLVHIRAQAVGSSFRSSFHFTCARCRYSSVPPDAMLTVEASEGQ